MAYREFRLVDIRAILRWWLTGLSQRAVARRTGFGRVTVRRYIDAAKEEGLQQTEGAESLTDELVGRVRRRVRPGRKGGFSVDSARVRRPKDKARVERMVTYVRENFFKGEHFVDLADARRRAEFWCRITAGQRNHGTTCLQPATVFEVEELPLLESLPTEPYDPPIFADPKVGRDQHFSLGRALYSMPKNLVGCRVHVRADSQLVKVWLNGEYLRAHPRQPPGGRSTLPEDIDAHIRPYVQRDPEDLLALAEKAGPAVLTYARRLLDGPHPWRRMRHLYRLLNLVRRFGPDPVNRSCELALELDVVDVVRVERVVERAGDTTELEPPPSAAQARPRFARPDEHFNVTPFRKEPT